MLQRCGRGRAVLKFGAYQPAVLAFTCAAAFTASQPLQHCPVHSLHFLLFAAQMLWDVLRMKDVFFDAFKGSPVFYSERLAAGAKCATTVRAF